MAHEIIRQLNHLKLLNAQFPDLSKNIDLFRRGRGVDLPTWPSWCFLPFAAWIAIASGGGSVGMAEAAMSAKLAALATWRYTKGIYRFDESLLTALSDTVIKGDMPVEVFYHLPEWCVYIETAGMTCLDLPLLGFYAQLEFDINTQRHELRLLLDFGDSLADLIAVPLHMGNHTVTEAVDRAAAESQRNAILNRATFSLSADQIQKNAADYNKLLSLLLYICSDAPEIENNREKGISPTRPQAVKIKGEWKLFPAEKIKVWDVGASVGEQLRKQSPAASAENAETGKGSPKRTHLRRGHWHGFWTGEGRQKFIYKWVPPTVVNG